MAKGVSGQVRGSLNLSDAGTADFKWGKVLETASPIFSFFSKEDLSGASSRISCPLFLRQVLKYVLPALHVFLV